MIFNSRRKIFTVLFFSGFFHQAFAADISIAPIPIEDSNTIDPNISILFDNSVSMDRDYLYQVVRTIKKPKNCKA